MLCIEGVYFNTIKVTDEKPSDNITQNDEELKSFLLRSATRRECPF